MRKYFKDYQEHKIPHTLGSFDLNGIPLFNPKSLNLKGKESYHPIVIVQYGLANYNLWLDNKENIGYKESFIKSAEWLLNNYSYHQENDIAIYFYDFDLKNPPIKAPWFSGMAQGQILSLFSRAFSVTKNEKYLNIGRKISNSFNATIDMNGCCSYLNGHLFIQEIAARPELFILNGAIYAVIGLCEFKEVGDVENENLDEIIKGLEGLLPKFDIGFWTKYSLGMRFNLSDVYYQKVHADQLLYLGESLENEVFLYYGKKFKIQLEKNAGWMKLIHFLSLSVNRGFRVFGMGKFLYKYK